MLYLLLIIWILSPLALIPLSIKNSSDKKKLELFISELYRKNRINDYEYSCRRVDNRQQGQSSMPSAPIFSDSLHSDKIQGSHDTQPAKTYVYSDAKTPDNKGVYSVPAQPAVKAENIPVQKAESTPVQPVVKTENIPAQKAENVPIQPAVKTESVPVQKVETAPVQPDIKTASAPVPPVYYAPAQTNENKPSYTYNAPKAPADKEEHKRAGAMSVLMIIGIIFVVLAGLIFSTAVWVNLGNLGRALAIAIVTAMFFGMSAFSKKKLKLEKTSFAFYTLGSFFTSITLITAGYFGLFGEYLSVNGKGSMVLYSAALAVLSLLTAKGKSLFDRPAAAFISSFSAAISAVLLMMQFTSDITGFALIAAIFTAAVSIAVFAADPSLPKGWETPVRTSAAVLNIAAVISGCAAAFENNSIFTAVGAVYVIRGIFSAVMGIKGKKHYSKKICAWVSLSYFSFFALMLIYNATIANEAFAFGAALVGIAFSAVFFVPDFIIPESWEKPVKTFALVLNCVGICFSVSALAGNFGSWNGFCFGCAALYILSSFGSAFMASRKNEIYGKAPSAFASLFTGMAFSVMTVFELFTGVSAAAMMMAVIFAVYLNAVFTANPKIPDGWKAAAYISAGVLCVVSVISSAIAFADNFGHWDAACYAAALIYIVQSAVIAIAAFTGHKEYNKTVWAVIAQVFGSAAIVITLREAAGGDKMLFGLLLAIFAVAMMNIVNTLKLNKPENWETPLCINAFVLCAFGSLYTFFTSSEWTACGYIAAGLYTAYALFIMIAAFFRHGEYERTHWAYISQFSFIFFAFMLIARLSPTGDVNTLAASVFAFVYMNVFFTLKIKKPENWRTAFDICSFFTGGYAAVYVLRKTVFTGVLSAQIVMGAALFILYAVFVIFAAFAGHGEYKKARWSFISQITGIIFIIALIAKLDVIADIKALMLTVFGFVYLNAVHTFKFKKPEGWQTALYICPFIAGAIGALLMMLEIILAGDLSVYCISGTAVIILYSLIIAALAFKGHEEYKKPMWAAVSEISGIFFAGLCAYNILEEYENSFMLFIAVLGALFTAAKELTFLKAPEKWNPVTRVIDIVFNSMAGLFALVVLVSENGFWDIYCALTGAVYTVYLGARGVLHKNTFLKWGEAVVCCFTAYNICELFFGDLMVSYGLICFVHAALVFLIVLAHRCIKPLRTLFSDIFLTCALAVAAIKCADDCSVYSVISFGLLGIIMLINALEKDKKSAKVFGALTFIPVCGMVFSAVSIYSATVIGRAAVSAVLSGAALTVIAACILFIKKKSGSTFYSFALAASAMLFYGSCRLSDTVYPAVFILAVVAGLALTAVFIKAENNLPSFITVIASAIAVHGSAVFIRTGTDVNVQLISAVVFAAAALIASRIVFCRKLFEKKDGRIAADSLCFGMLAALPMISSDNEKTVTFTFLLILAAFAANLARKEQNDSFNRSAITVGFALFTLALISRPFLIVEQRLFSWKINLIFASLFGLAFSLIWKKYPKLSENFSSSIYGICFVILIIDALTFQTLANTFIVLGVSLAILLASFVTKKKRWFAVSAIALTGLTIYTFRSFFAMIDWWVYLLIVGLILIAVSSANEYFVKKGKELKEKAGRFFEDWTW